MLSGVYGRGRFREGPGLDEESNFERRFRGVGFLSFDIYHLASVIWHLSSEFCLLTSGAGSSVSKGIWWMPWHREAMKDVARCEKPRGAVSEL